MAKGIIHHARLNSAELQVRTRGPSTPNSAFSKESLMPALRLDTTHHENAPTQGGIPMPPITRASGGAYVTGGMGMPPCGSGREDVSS